MYDICHPSYYYIGKLGCNNPTKIAATFYVYIELCEVKKFWDVKYKYHEELDLLYLEARQNKDSPIEIYVPWPTVHNITISEIEKMQEALKTIRLTLVFKAEDSSSVYYRVTAGLVKPVSPKISKQLKEKEEKKLALEKDIRRNITNLYDLAKSQSGNAENPVAQASTSELDIKLT